jgi:hypothetical protein
MMKMFWARLLVATSLLFAGAPLAAWAEQPGDPGSDRASAFQAGEPDPQEAFAQAEGTVWLAAAFAVCLGVFTLLVIAQLFSLGSRQGMDQLQNLTEQKGGGRDAQD